MTEALLRPVEIDDIQLLRYWRNLTHVRTRMVVTRCVGRDEQRKWFETLDSAQVRYFIFSYGLEDVGCVNLTKIDLSGATFEGGIFCGNVSFLGHWINIWACIRLYDHAFFELGLSTAYATVLKSNAQALNLNRNLGYEFLEEIDVGISRYRLTSDTYVAASERLRRYLRHFAQQAA